MADLIDRQAAIDAFDGHFAIVGRSSAERFKMYIEAVINDIRKLPPAQPEQCEDAVSRKDCLKALSNMMDTDGFRNGWAVSRANVECMLKAMPSVMPKQRTGKWLMNDHIGTFKIFTCDKCGWNSEAPFNFCPNCGDKKEQLNKTCDCYSDGSCVGTKEIDSCSCGGVKSKCDFYEHVRREGEAE